MSHPLLSMEACSVFLQALRSDVSRREEVHGVHQNDDAAREICYASNKKRTVSRRRQPHNQRAWNFDMVLKLKFRRKCQQRDVGCFK